jgi:hypothetical protein
MLTCRFVSLFLLTFAEPLERIQRGQFGGSEEVKFNLPFEISLFRIQSSRMLSEGQQT